MKRTIILVTVLALGAAACGDDDAGSPADQALVDAIAAEMLSDNVGDAGEISEDQANCVAEDVVSGLGADTLAEYGITPEAVAAIDEVGLSEDDAATVADAMAGCVDLKELFLEGMAASGEMPQDAVDCVDDLLSDDLMRDLMVVSLTGGDPEAAMTADQELVAGLMECTTAG